MKKTRILLIVLLILFILAGLSLVLFNFFIPKAAGLLIETSPASTVYIDGEEVGRTPFTSVRKAGELSVRLVPDSFGQPLPSYEDRIGLVSGVETVVRRYFGESEKLTEGETFSFEKLADKDEVAIVVVTDPANVQIQIDSVNKGTSPYSSSSLEPGRVELKLNTSYYKERTLEVNLVRGYKLIAYVKLAGVDGALEKVEEEKKATSSAAMVRILKTPTGFLRVRKEASVAALEIGQVEPGDEYELLEEEGSGDWFKILLDDGESGWVTKQYSEKIENTATPSADAEGVTS